MVPETRVFQAADGLIHPCNGQTDRIAMAKKR